VQHRLPLNSQLNIVGAVSLRMDDGLALDSTPVAIGLYDPSSGASAIIAALTNSTAVQVMTEFYVVCPISQAITLAYDALNRLTNTVDEMGTTAYS